MIFAGWLVLFCLAVGCQGKQNNNNNNNNVLLNQFTNIGVKYTRQQYNGLWNNQVSGPWNNHVSGPWNNQVSGPRADWTSVWIAQFQAGLRAVNTRIKGKKDSTDGVSCVDENGHPVDWWILYKLPRPEKHHKKTRKAKKYKNKAKKYMNKKAKSNGKAEDSNIEEGTAYVYMLSSDKTKKWTLSDKSVEDPDSVPGRTLAPIYQNRSDLFYALYNDEHPDGPTSFDLGHTKGVVFGDAKDSVWLIHSVPHYPPYPNQTYGYPHTGHRYGQSYMCQSVPTSTLDSIGTQLSYNEPYLYAVNLPAWTADYPAMQQAAAGKHIKTAPFFSTAAWKTSAGVKVTSFAKFSKFGKDLYADLVAPSLQTPLLVETWPNGRGRMLSNCSVPFIVENVAELDFPGVNGEDFTTRHDHAKWAISLDEKSPYVCVGDINRMETQRKRGGGTACFEDLNAWNTFRNTIKDVEACPRHPRT